MRQYRRPCIFLLFGAFFCLNLFTFINTANAADANAVSFARTTLTIINEDGQQHIFKGEYAYTKQQLAHGLMFRKYIADDYAMLFDFMRPRSASFWMKNTLIPLDMIFIDSAFSVVGIVHNAEPETLTSRSVEEPSRYVLEINGGLAERYGIGTGTRVHFEDIELTPH